MGPDIETIKAHSVEVATFQLKVHGADEHTINHVRQSILNWVEAAYRNGQIDSYEKRSPRKPASSTRILRRYYLVREVQYCDEDNYLVLDSIALKYYGRMSAWQHNQYEAMTRQKKRR